MCYIIHAEKMGILAQKSTLGNKTETTMYMWTCVVKHTVIIDFILMLLMLWEKNGCPFHLQPEQRTGSHPFFHGLLILKSIITTFVQYLGMLLYSKYEDTFQYKLR